MHSFSWSEITALTHLLAEKAGSYSVEGVAGVSRSGLIPAVMLSHILSIRPFAVLDIARTKSDAVDASKQPPRCRGVLNIEEMKGRRVLLVDDIVGAGLTIATARQLLVDAQITPIICSLVVNQANLGERKPADFLDFWGCVVHGWVVFPWEGKAPADA